MEELADNNGLSTISVERIYDSMLSFDCVNKNSATKSLRCLKNLLMKNLDNQEMDEFAFACALYDVYDKDASKDVYLLQRKMMKKD